MQKFQKGDLVHVQKDLGEYMTHFTSDIDAIVMGSYADQFGGNNTKDYTLYLKGKGECSWYFEHQLHLIEKDRLDLLEVWKKEKNKKEEKFKDKKWIFSRTEKDLKDLNNLVAVTLAKDLGIKDLWGSYGEGVIFQHNCNIVLSMAITSILEGDIKGWNKISKKFKEETKDLNDNQKLFLIEEVMKIVETK